MEALISVIVPCYNQAQYLPEALQSVYNQTYQSWECIIVNDGSPDNTEEIAHEWCKKDDRFKYIFKENGGLSSARNAGIDNSLGKYILPLDADDLINYQYVELAIKCFNSDSSISLVYCEAEKFGAESGKWELEKYSFIKMLISNQIFCSAIYKKDDWAKVGGYDEKLNYGWEDWDFWIKLLNQKSIVYQIPQILFYYRVKISSMIKDMQLKKQESIRWEIYNKNRKVYSKHFRSPITVIAENNSFRGDNIVLESQLLNILSSKSYRIGNFLLTPLSYFKRLYLKSKIKQ